MIVVLQRAEIEFDVAGGGRIDVAGGDDGGSRWGVARRGDCAAGFGNLADARTGWIDRRGQQFAAGAGKGDVDRTILLEGEAGGQSDVKDRVGVLPFGHQNGDVNPDDIADRGIDRGLWRGVGNAAGVAVGFGNNRNGRRKGLDGGGDRGRILFADVVTIARVEIGRVGGERLSAEHGAGGQIVHDLALDLEGHGLAGVQISRQCGGERRGI